MLCPECQTETYLDHTTTEGETTRYFYTCPKKGCLNYLKILNGNEEGKKASITEKLQVVEETPIETVVETITEETETTEQEETE